MEHDNQFTSPISLSNQK